MDFTFSTSPAAQILLPNEATLGKIRQWRALEGEGLEADLVVDGKVIGQLADEGTGGGVWYRPSVPFAEGRQVVEWLVTTWQAARKEADPEASDFMPEESLWNDMVEEALTRKDLDKKTKGTKARPGKVQAYKGEMRVRQGDDTFGWTAPEWYSLTVPVADLNRYRAVLLKDGFTHYWNGERWEALDG